MLASPSGTAFGATMALVIFEEEKRGANLGIAGLSKIIQTG